MTDPFETQELPMITDHNHQQKDRRRFITAAVSGVIAGVIRAIIDTLLKNLASH